MNVAANNDSCLLAEQRIWDISVQVSSSIQRPRERNALYGPLKNKKKRSIQVLGFEKDQSDLSYFLKFSQLWVSS